MSRTYPQHLLFLFLIGTLICTAQTPDLQHMKAKLQQLELMVQDLRNQLAAAEKHQKAPAPGLSLATN